MTSLFGALKTTFSAFNSINSAIQVAGDNIANANNADYNRQIEVYEDERWGGVKITDIIRLADEGLRRDLLRATTESSENDVLSTLYAQLEELTGGALSQTYLSDTVQEFGDAWKAFEAAPENFAAEREVVRLGFELSKEFERLSEGLDSLENQLREDVIDLVDKANQLLYEVDRLNEYIVRDKSKGISTASFENNRDAALTDLAEIIDIRTFGHDNGALTLYSSEGLVLVDLDESELTWDLNTMSLTLKGNSGNLVGTAYMPGGELGAKINMMRVDVEATGDADHQMAPIEKMRNQLDELAYQFLDDASAAAIASVPVNPGQSLLDISGIAVGDQFTIRAATTDDQNAVTQHTLHTITLTENQETGILTLEDMVDQINNLTIPDGEPEIRARITAHGTLEINTTAGSLTLADLTGSPLGDLKMIPPTADGATPVPQTFAERLPPTFAKSYNDSPLLEGQSAVVFETLDGNTPLGTNRMNFRINEDLFNGTTTLKDLSSNAVMTALYSNNREITGSGSSFENMTYLGLASAILTDLSGRASHSSNMSDISKNMRDGMEHTMRNKVGVDIDEEMMKLTVLENSYAAAAKALDTIQKMFESLEAAV